MLFASVLSTALLFTSASAATGTVTDAPLIRLPYAQYLGNTTTGITSWRGIRYAAAPVGDLRWRAPQDPVVNNKTVQTAYNFSARCVQTDTVLDFGRSEDCLFLNVFAPSNATADSKLPVYVFIQGGGFNDNSNPNYTGNGLIEASGKKMVVVTFNYRVSLYGFLASKEVVANGSTNLGLLDQRKVLHWIQDYISLFGGDPKHVVLGGASAGAASVSLHLVAYGGRNDNLFHATAAESQSFGAQFTIDEAQYQYNNLVNRTGCTAKAGTTASTLECLRKKTTKELQKVNFNIPVPGGVQAPIYQWSAVVDGNFSTNLTYALFEQDKYLKLPAIWGADTNDGTVFAPKSLNSTTDMNTFLAAQYPALNSTQLARIDQLYPKGTQYPNASSYWSAAAAAYGDMRYMCPGLFISSQYSAKNVSVWNYRYNVVASNTTGYGATHTSELGAIWGPKHIPTPPESLYTFNKNIVPVIQNYWVSFIRSYDPNTYRLAGSPLWEEWTSKDMDRLILQTNYTRMGNLDNKVQLEKCAYFHAIALDVLGR